MELAWISNPRLAEIVGFVGCKDDVGLPIPFKTGRGDQNRIVPVAGSRSRNRKRPELSVGGDTSISRIGIGYFHRGIQNDRPLQPGRVPELCKELETVCPKTQAVKSVKAQRCCASFPMSIDITTPLKSDVDCEAPTLATLRTCRLGKSKSHPLSTVVECDEILMLSPTGFKVNTVGSPWRTTKPFYFSVLMRRF